MPDIQVTLRPDPKLQDPEHKSGLTNEGYEQLMQVLQRAGFEIVNGPTRRDAVGEYFGLLPEEGES